MRKQDVKAISIVLPFRQNFMTLLHFPRRCHGLFSLCLVASFRRISQIPDSFSNLPAIGIMFKQETVSSIISDTWKTHKQVCAGNLPNGENRNMGKH